MIVSLKIHLCRTWTMRLVVFLFPRGICARRPNKCISVIVIKLTVKRSPAYRRKINDECWSISFLLNLSFKIEFSFVKRPSDDISIYFATILIHLNYAPSSALGVRISVASIEVRPIIPTIASVQLRLGEWYKQVNDSSKVFASVEGISCGPIILSFLNVGPNLCLVLLPVLRHFLVQSDWLMENFGPLRDSGNVFLQLGAFRSNAYRVALQNLADVILASEFVEYSRNEIAGGVSRGTGSDSCSCERCFRLHFNN